VQTAVRQNTLLTGRCIAAATSPEDESQSVCAAEIGWVMTNDAASRKAGGFNSLHRHGF